MRRAQPAVTFAHLHFESSIRRCNELQPYQSQRNGEAANDPIAADVAGKSRCDLGTKDGTNRESYRAANTLVKQTCGDMGHAACQSGYRQDEYGCRCRGVERKLQKID
jgi:hypothetical protein